MARSSMGAPLASQAAQVQTMLERTIEAERAQLLQAHALLTCLYEVLLYADAANATAYAETARVAARLVDESVERLDVVRLRSAITALQSSSTEQPHPEKAHGDEDDVNAVREQRVRYLC